MRSNPICIRVTGDKNEMDLAIKEVNAVLVKLCQDRDMAFNTVLNYPESFLVKFDRSEDAAAVSKSISSALATYDETARRTKNGAEKYWTDDCGKVVLRMVLVDEKTGYERGWNI